jgi:hypothetical protein
VQECTENVKAAVSELISLTNIAFHVEDQSRPIFVLDNGHQFAEVYFLIVSILNFSLMAPQLQTNVVSKVKGTHNGLSAILTSLTQWRCPAIVAGTTDKEIHKFADFSNFVVEHIFLTPLGREHWNQIGLETIAKLNKQHNSNVVWQTVDVAESRDVDEQVKDSDDGYVSPLSSSSFFFLLSFFFYFFFSCFFFSCYFFFYFFFFCFFFFFFTFF